MPVWKTTMVCALPLPCTVSAVTVSVFGPAESGTFSKVTLPCASLVCALHPHGFQHQPMSATCWSRMGLRAASRTVNCAVPMPESVMETPGMT